MEVSMSKTRRGKYTDNRICYISKCKGNMRLYLRRKGKLPCFSYLVRGKSFSFYRGKEALKCSGKIYSEQHRRNFDIKDDILRVENDPDDESRLNLTINRKPIADWFREQWHRLRYGARVPQQEERKSRGFKL